jgi:carbamoyl-phosphate synthase large subunit
VDCLCDGERAVVAGLMEHVEAAGIHSGDSACILPPVHLSDDILATISAHAERLAFETGVRGLMNAQFAVKDDTVYVLEVNPRASRTVPFVSKAIGHPLAKYAALIAVGRKLDDIGFTTTPRPAFYSAKEVHLPFIKFRDVIPVLGPEMKSTGESMGIDSDPFLAYYRAQLGANVRLPKAGRILLVGEGLDAVGDEFALAGFEVSDDASGGLPDLLIDVTGSRLLRRALEAGIPYYSTVEAAAWVARALRKARSGNVGVTSLQDWHLGRQPGAHATA